MTIEEMHYNVKFKLNKVDSQQYRNLLIPEIDVALNEAISILIEIIAEPRKNKSELGFEVNQKSIDDIRTLVVRPESNPESNISINNNIAKLPKNYLHFIKGDVIISKGVCKNIKANLYIRQHDDLFEDDPFSKSSFEWRTVNGVFFSNGIRLFDDGNFTNNKLLLTYIRKPAYVHNAKNFYGSSYKLPSGLLLKGSVNCDLPEQIHKEVVDIAVYLLSNSIQDNGVNNKLNKIAFNELK